MIKRYVPLIFFPKRRLPATHDEARTAEDTPQLYLRVNYHGIFCRIGLLFFVCMFVIQALICGVSLLMVLTTFGETILFILTCMSFANAHICEYVEIRKHYYFFGIASGIFTIFLISLTFILL